MRYETYGRWPRDIPGPGISVVLWGLAPVLFAALSTTALLWGAGYDLGAAEHLGHGHTEVRGAVAWLAGTALLLLFSFPLVGLVVDLLRGRWGGAILRRLAAPAVNLQRRRRARLAAKFRRADKRDGAWIPVAVALGFPRAGELAPTALGNAEAALLARVAARYRLDLAVVWPVLSALLPAPECQRLTTAGRHADAALFRAAGWLLAVLWLLAGSMAVPRHPAVFAALAGAVAAAWLYASAYRQAVDRRISYGRLVESAVDLHRISLLAALGWPQPRTQDQEREYLAELSDVLAGRTNHDRTYRFGNAGPEDLGDALNAAVADLPDRLTESVLHRMDSGLDEHLAPTLDRALRRSLAGPLLANFDGHLLVSLSGPGGPVPVDAGGQAVVVPGRYDLIVTVGPRPGPEGATVPVRIRGGEDRVLAPFAVSLDSSVIALRQPEQPLPVERGGAAEVRIPVAVGAWAQPQWLWVRLSQQGRTIQNLELTMVPPEPDT